MCNYWMQVGCCCCFSIREVGLIRDVERIWIAFTDYFPHSLLPLHKPKRRACAFAAMLFFTETCGTSFVDGGTGGLHCGPGSRRDYAYGGIIRPNTATWRLEGLGNRRLSTSLNLSQAISASVLLFPSVLSNKKKHATVSLQAVVFFLKTSVACVKGTRSMIL